MKKYILGLLGLAAFSLFVGVLMLSRPHKQTNTGLVGSANNNVVQSASTTVFNLAAGTAAQLVATSTNRVWTRIVTTSTGVYVRYGGAVATVATSEPLSSPLVFDLDHLFIGTISVISPAAATVSVTELSY